MNSDFIKIYEEKPWYKDKNHLPTFLVFLFLTSMLGYTLYVDGNSNDLKYVTSFNGRIDKTFDQKNILYIKLSNEKRWIKLNNFKNENYSDLGYDFMSIIKKGDTIYKTKNSYSINMIRLGNEYSFKIDKIK
jgi:hypothetical protein